MKIVQLVRRILPVAKSIEHLPLSEDSPILRALQTLYLNAVRGVVPHSVVGLDVLPSCKLSASARTVGKP